MDIGILQTGAQNTLILITEDDYEYILNHSAEYIVFISDAEILSKFNKDKVPSKKYFLLIIEFVKLEGITSSLARPQQSN
jgi:hypothetical protein